MHGIDTWSSPNHLQFLCTSSRIYCDKQGLLWVRQVQRPAAMSTNSWRTLSLNRNSYIFLGSFITQHKQSMSSLADDFFMGHHLTCIPWMFISSPRFKFEPDFSTEHTATFQCTYFIYTWHSSASSCASVSIIWPPSQRRSLVSSKQTTSKEVKQVKTMHLSSYEAQ